jgi:hypothetical protein
MKRHNITRVYSLVQSVLRFFRGNGKTGPHPHILVGSEKDAFFSVDLNAWKISEIALIDAERRKAQAYMNRLRDSAR